MTAAVYKVNTSTLKAESAELRHYCRNLYSVESSVRRVMRELQSMQGSPVMIGSSLGRICDRMTSCAENMGSMSRVLEEIGNLYHDAEKRITGEFKSSIWTASGAAGIAASVEHIRRAFLELIRRLFGEGNRSTAYEMDSVVFDDDGGYGGDQGSPRSQQGSLSEQQDLYDIVRSHFPDMTDAQIRDYLEKLNSEGCSYVASINSVFAAYEGREAEFQETFGRPMYKNGDLNYNEMLVDFYCETDNHVQRKGKDYFDPSEDPSARTGKGVSHDDQHYRLESYLSSHGVDVQTSYENITVKNFRRYSENGYVVMHFRDGTMYAEDGTPYEIKGGHAMMITGVTEDGKYIVSSWGEKYTIDPSEGTQSYSYYQYE